MTRKQVLQEETESSICGAPSTDVDHIVPLWAGGSSDRGNLQGLCRPCYRAKTRIENTSGNRRSRRPDPSLMYLSEIAERLGVAYQTARRWVSRGQFVPAVSVPGWPSQEWWRWADVEAWARATGRLK